MEATCPETCEKPIKEHSLRAQLPVATTALKHPVCRRRTPQVGQILTWTQIAKIETKKVEIVRSASTE
jgi:hypothetical protein